MPAPSVTLRFPQPDLAVIAFCDPLRGANVLSRAVLAELAVLIDQVAAHNGLLGVIVCSDKPGSFLAGADIRELAARFDTPKSEVLEYCRTGRRLFQRLSQLPFPSVAAIDGLALGGGCELALWCDYRILSTNPKTAIGFPEVKLGLIPGWGGTWTATQLAGLGNAVELICGGEPVTAERARLLGLADDMVAPAELLPAAERWMRDLHQQAAQQKSGSSALANIRAARSRPLKWSGNELAFLTATAAAQIQKQTKGEYPAPLIALKVLTETAGETPDGACDRAAAEMAELMGTPVNRALVRVFLATERNKKDPGIAADRAAGLTPCTVKTLGVIGAGIMGNGIAAASLKKSLPIVLLDANADTLTASVTKILEEAAWDKTSRKIDPQRALQMTPLLKAAANDAALSQCDLVVEAIVENLEVKKQVLARIEAIVAPQTVLGSNTSTILIGRIAAALKRPDQFCGLHFFNPVRKMTLVEIIRGPATSDQTILTAVAFAKQLGKTPVVVNDGPGFLVNRLLSPYLNEAIALLHEGVSCTEIDAAATSFGMPLGPFALYDMVGIDTSLFAGRTMFEAFRERYILSPVLVELYKNGRLGQKSGAGFYRYAPGSDQPLPDPAGDELLRGHLHPAQTMPREKLIWRLFLPMVLEATRVLTEKIVRDPHDIDLGVILGLGFPAFRGGILAWADTVGLPRVLDQVRRYEALSVRWQPTEMLVEMGTKGERFLLETNS